MPPSERQALAHVVRHGHGSGPQLSPVGQPFVLSKRYGIERLQEFLKVGDARHAYLETLHIQDSFKRGIALDVLFHHGSPTPSYSFSWKIPILAVNPCRKLLVPMGPISPLQKKPARGMAPAVSATTRLSWSGSP